VQLAVIPRGYRGPKEINLEDGEMWERKGQRFHAGKMGNLSL